MYKRLLKKQTQMAETLFSHHDVASSLLLKARRQSVFSTPSDAKSTLTDRGQTLIWYNFNTLKRFYNAPCIAFRHFGYAYLEKMRSKQFVSLGGGRCLPAHFCLTFPFVLNRLNIPLFLRRTPLRFEFIGCMGF